MGVLSITERQDGREGEWTATSGRSYTRVFNVVTDDAKDGPFTVLSAMGGKNGDRYVSGNDHDKTSFLMKLTATNDTQSGKHWKVVATYGPYDATQQGNPEDPLSDPPEINWGFKSYEKVVEVDKDDKPVLNTAFEKFDPPLTDEDQTPILSIVRNESPSGFSLPAIQQYVGAVNSDSFAGWDAGCVKCSNILPKRMYNATIGYYYQVQYDFEFNVKGFTRKIPSMGMRQLSSDGTKIEQIYVQGTATTNPVLLDEKGRMLPPDSDPHVMEFRTRDELPFDAFNFDEAVLTGQA